MKEILLSLAIQMNDAMNMNYWIHDIYIDIYMAK